MVIRWSASPSTAGPSSANGCWFQLPSKASIVAFTRASPGRASSSDEVALAVSRPVNGVCRSIGSRARSSASIRASTVAG